MISIRGFPDFSLVEVINGTAGQLGTSKLKLKSEIVDWSVTTEKMNQISKLRGSAFEVKSILESTQTVQLLSNVT